MFTAAAYVDMYKRFLGPLARRVTVQVNNGTDFDPILITAHVSTWRELDLIPDGSIRLGDLRLIILQEEIDAMSVPKLETKDRIVVDGRPLGVIHWDQYSRSVGEVTVAVEVTVRG